MKRVWRGVAVAAAVAWAALGVVACDSGTSESTAPETTSPSTSTATTTQGSTTTTIAASSTAVTVFGQLMLNFRESTLPAHGLTGECEGVGLASGVEVGTTARVLTQDGQVVAQGVIVRSEGSEDMGGFRLDFEIEGLPVLEVEVGGDRELRAVTDGAYDVSIGSQLLDNIPAQTLVDLHLDLRLRALQRVLYVSLSEGGPAVTFPQG